MTETFNILWRDLGCPLEPGMYPYAGKLVKVEQRHIEAAEGTPDAVFVVIGAKPLSGPSSYVLGSRQD